MPKSMAAAVVLYLQDLLFDLCAAVYKVADHTNGLVVHTTVFRAQHLQQTHATPQKSEGWLLGQETACYSFALTSTDPARPAGQAY